MSIELSVASSIPLLRTTWLSHTATHQKKRQGFGSALVLIPSLLLCTLNTSRAHVLVSITLF